MKIIKWILDTATGIMLLWLLFEIVYFLITLNSFSWLSIRLTIAVLLVGIVFRSICKVLKEESKPACPTKSKFQERLEAMDKQRKHDLKQ